MKKIIYTLIGMFILTHLQASVIFVNSLASGKNNGQRKMLIQPYNQP